MAKTTGNRYLAETFAAYGVTYTFMVPTIVLPALAEMESLGITTVMTHGEKAAAYMADGYARVSGRPGICMAQAIGAANLAAGLRDAYMGSSPVIALTGGRSPLFEYRHVYQEIVDFPLYEQVTKMNVELDAIERLPDLLRQSFRAATTGSPGPVHMELRGHLGEILDEEFEVTDATGPLAEERFARTPAFRTVAERESLHEALELLSRAERPIIIAGNGVVRSRASEALATLAQRLQIPVATSLHAKSVFAEDHPLGVGVVGGSSRPSANQAVLEADLVFLVGTHAGSQVTGGWHLPPPGAQVVQLDIDPLELGRNYPNAVSLLGDARATLAALVELAEKVPERAAWTARTGEIVQTWRREHEEVFSSTTTPMRPERLCRAITEALPPNGILTTDTGHSGIWVAEYVDLRPGQSFIRASGSLGWSFPASLGAKCAAPERPVICFTGDGGAYYHVGELETAVRNNIEAVIVVNDNSAYSQNVGLFNRAYDNKQTDASRRLWNFEPRNFAEIAQSFGCPAIRVEDPDDVRDALEEALRTPGPTVVDVVTDKDAFPDRPFGGVGSYP